MARETAFRVTSDDRAVSKELLQPWVKVDVNRVGDAPVEFVKLPSRKSPLILSKVSGIDARALVDSGSDLTVLAEDFARKCKFPRTSGPPLCIRYASGATETCTSYVRVQVSLKEDGSDVKSIVIPVAGLYNDVDMIVGFNYLEKFDITVNYGQRRIAFGDGSVMPLQIPDSTHELSDGSLVAKMSYRAIRRMIAPDKKDTKAFLVFIGGGSVSIRATSMPLVARIISDDQQSEFANEILREFADVFPDQLPPDKPVSCEHDIELLPGSEPVRQKTFRQAPDQLREIKRLIDEMLVQDIIQPSESPWASPVILVKKSDDSWRFCIDYRALNQRTKKNAYSLPNIQDNLEQLKGATFFTSLDLRSGYHQIRMAEGAMEKTAFSTRYGNYEFRVMPFGLCNAPATFQKFMNSVFRDAIDDFVVVYLDDILIYSKNLSDHKRHVRAVLARLRENSLFGKLSKCRFAQESVDFLGYVVSHDTIGMQECKLEGFRKYAIPKSVHQVHRFLGATGFYRRFVPKYAKIADPLVELTRGSKKKFYWHEGQQQAFDILIAELLKNATLFIPDVSGRAPFEIETDASNDCYGALLRQNEKLVDCFSAMMSPAETRYDVREKEMLAIVKAVRRWAPYIKCAPTTVFTDHKSLSYLTTMSMSGYDFENSRVWRWYHKVLAKVPHIEYVYRPGPENAAADALSRMHRLDHISVAAEADEVTTTVVDSNDMTSDIADAYAFDKEWQTVWKTLKGIEVPPQRGKLRLRCERSHMDERGLIYYRPSDIADVALLVVPSGPSDTAQSFRQRLMQEHHEADHSGHFSVKRSAESLFSRYWWNSMVGDYLAFCKSCLPCQRSKTGAGTARGPLRPLAVPTEPWTHITMDFLSGMKKCKGFDNLLVVVDRLTKFVIIEPCTKLTSKATAELFLRSVVRRFGMPISITTDRGPEFNSELFHHFLALMGTKLKLSTAHHPQTDGQTERANRTIVGILRTLLSSDYDDWVSKLPMVEFAINNTTHASTRHTAFYLNHGRDPLVPADVIAGKSETNKTAMEIAEEVRMTLRRVERHLAGAQECAAEQADKKVKLITFAKGDYVLVHSTKVRPAVEREMFQTKFGARFVGPYQVEQDLGNNAYRIRLPKAMKAHNVINGEHLKPVNLRSDFNPPALWSDEGGTFYEPEKVISRKVVRGIKLYLVRWKGYSPSEDTWEPLSNLELAPNLVKQYEASLM